MLDELWDLGVRQMEITNKFDNQLTGVAGDGGSTGDHRERRPVPDRRQLLGLRPLSGRLRRAQPRPHPRDRRPHLPGRDLRQRPRGLRRHRPIILPVYTARSDSATRRRSRTATRGETNLGGHALDGIMERGFVFDPDHMSVLARDEALDQVEAARLSRRHLLPLLVDPEHAASRLRARRHGHALRRQLERLRERLGADQVGRGPRRARRPVLRLRLRRGRQRLRLAGRPAKPGRGSRSRPIPSPASTAPSRSTSRSRAPRPRAALTTSTPTASTTTASIRTGSRTSGRSRATRSSKT